MEIENKTLIDAELIKIDNEKAQEQISEQKAQEDEIRQDAAEQKREEYRQ